MQIIENAILSRAWKRSGMIRPFFKVDIISQNQGFPLSGDAVVRLGI
ncbi:hypothetical protein [Burkholderia sp. PU8-34]